MTGTKSQNIALVWWIFSSLSLIGLLLRLAWDAPMIFFFVASAALVLSGACAIWGNKRSNQP